MLYYLLILILKFFWMIICFIFAVIAKIFELIFLVLKFVVRLIVFLIMGIYFMFKCCCPSKSQTPFMDDKRVKALENMNARENLLYVVCIDLDKVIVHWSEREPKDGPFLEVKTYVPGDEGNILYVQPRPFLAEFLEEVR